MKQRSHPIASRSIAILMCFALLIGLFPVDVAYAIGDSSLTLNEQGAVTYGEETTQDGVTFKTLYGKKVSTVTGRLDYGELRYWLYLPENYDANKEYPLVVFLHGSHLSYNRTAAEGQGRTPWTDTLNKNTYKIADKLQNVLGDYIIFVPQCPGQTGNIVSGSAWTTMAGDKWASATQEQLNSADYGSTDYLLAAENMLSDYIANGVAYDSETTYGVDDNRVYLIGDSMGAIGSYAMLKDCPTTFAAAILRAGMGQTVDLEWSKTTPVVVAHGTADTQVPYARCQDMLAALEAVDTKDVQKFMVEGASHEIRQYLYNESPDNGQTFTYMTWLAQQSRSDYVIESYEDYDNLRKAVNSGDETALAYVSGKVGATVADEAAAAALDVSLEADFTISTPGAGIGVSASPFTGTFDGNGHTITFDITGSGETLKNTALFGTVSGTVRNLKLAGSMSFTDSALVLGKGTAISGGGLQRIATLAGAGNKGSHIENVVSDVDITYTDAGASTPADGKARHLSVTGLVGYHQGTTTNCTVSGDIDVTLTVVSSLYLGGITQAPMYTMKGVKHTGNITVTHTAGTGTNFWVGGFGALIGSTPLTAIDCVNSGNVTVTHTGGTSVRVGGFIGVSRDKTTTFINCANTGAISATGLRAVYAGGFIGLTGDYATQTITVTDCTNTGAVTAALTENPNVNVDVCAGGIIGKMEKDSTMKASGTVVKTGTIQVSAGTSAAKLSNQINGFAGGMIGRATGGTIEIEKSLVSANVWGRVNSSHTSAVQRIAGMVGITQANTTLTDSFFSGAISVGNGTSGRSGHYAANGSVTYSDYGHSCDSSAALGEGAGKLVIDNIPAEGVVSLSGISLTEGETPVWTGDALPEVLGFAGSGVSLNDDGRLCYATAGSIEVTVTWCGHVLGSKTVTVNVCEHSYGSWEHTAVDTHSRTCLQCGDLQTEAHAYTSGTCVCGRTESGNHTHEFSDDYRGGDLYHFHDCSWPGCDVIRDEEKHTYSNGVCTVCGYSSAFSEEGQVYEIASAEDYYVLLQAVNSGDEAALVKVAEKLAGEWYVEGMTATQAYAAKLDVLQTADITLSASGAVKPVGVGTSDMPFTGDYDGGGKSVTFDAVALSGEAVENVGLLGCAKGSIRNVVLKGSISYTDDLLLMSGNYVAPLAAYFSGGVIDNCQSEVDITYSNGTADTFSNNSELWIFGLVGKNESAGVTNCKVSGDITVTNGQALKINVAGVASQFYLVFEEVEYSGKITVNDTRASHLYVGGVGARGGISASDGNSVKRLTNNGTITISASGRALDESRLAMIYTGGILAQNENSSAKTWTLEECVNNGDITISGGNSNGTNSSGTVINDNAYAGGILGHTQMDKITILNCTNNGDINITNNGVGANRSNYNVRLGGIVGAFNRVKETLTIKGCVNNGNIHAENVEGAYWRSTIGEWFEAAGMLGEMTQATSTVVLEDCTNNGDISSLRTENIFIGGLVGDARGNMTAKDVMNTGDLGTADDTYTNSVVGGLVGLSRKNLTVDEFTNTGNITASLKDSPNSGEVTAAAGGVLGEGSRYSATPAISMTDIVIGGTVTAKTNEKASGYAGYAIGRITFGSYTSDAQCITITYYTPTAVLSAEQTGTQQDLVGKQESSVKDANFNITHLGVQKDEQVVTAQNVTATMADTDVTITASTTGDGALSYAVISGEDVVSVDAQGKLTFLKAGTATIRVTAAETDTYKKAEYDITVTVWKADQVVTANNVIGSLGDTGVKISASATGDGALSYAITSGDDVVYVYGAGELAFLKVGTATVRVSAAATNSYKAAYVDITITVREKAPSGGGIVYVDPYYTLTFATNGGSAINPVSDVLDTRVDLSRYVPVREGYAFAGWYSDAALTMEVTSVQLRSDMTVYAKWTGTMPFTDIEKDHQFYDPIQWAYTNGYMIGKTATFFDRVSPVTRQQVWRVLARVVNGEDLPDMAAAREWAVQNGISDGTRPGDPATRQEMVTMLWIACGKPAPASRSVLNSYPDVGDVSAACVAAMAWAVEKGIIQGTLLKTLNPLGETTRGAFAAILYRYCH